MRRYWKNLLWGVLALVLCACAAGHEIVGEAVQQPPEALLAETEAAPAALVETREEMVPVREWTYVLAAAFPVIEDGVQAGSLEAAWRG